MSWIVKICYIIENEFLWWTTLLCLIWTLSIGWCNVQLKTLLSPRNYRILYELSLAQFLRGWAILVTVLAFFYRSSIKDISTDFLYISFPVLSRIKHSLRIKQTIFFQTKFFSLQNKRRLLKVNFQIQSTKKNKILFLKHAFEFVCVFDCNCIEEIEIQYFHLLYAIESQWHFKLAIHVFFYNNCYKLLNKNYLLIISKNKKQTKQKFLMQKKCNI